MGFWRTGNYDNGVRGAAQSGPNHILTNSGRQGYGYELRAIPKVSKPVLLVGLALPPGLYEIVNSANTAVGFSGDAYIVSKISGAPGYNAGAVSTTGITGDFVLSLKALTTTSSNGFGGGMNTDPNLDQDYTSVDFLFINFPSVNQWAIYESGGLIASSVATNADTVWIWRIGTTLFYGHGATLAAAQATPDRTVTNSATLYFDSIFTDVGDSLNVVLTDYPASATVPLTGQAAAISQGSLLSLAAPALTTRLLSVSAGTITVATSDVTAALAGQALSVSRGTLSAQGALALTGQTLAVTRGTLTEQTSPALAGQGVVVGQGSVVVNANDRTAALTGQSLTVARGSLTSTASSALTGQGVVVARGSVVGTVSRAITGQGAVIGRGSVATSASPVLTGQSVTASRGSLAFTYGAIIAGGQLGVSLGAISRSLSASIPARPPAPSPALGLTMSLGTLGAEINWHVVSPAPGPWANDDPDPAVWTEVTPATGTWN